MMTVEYNPCALGSRATIAAGAACAAVLLALSPVRAAALPPAQTAPALLAKIELLGRPTAHMTLGTQVQIQGMVLNTDSKQHDAYLSATLFDAQRHVVGHAVGKAEDLKPGRRGVYSLTGSVMAPRWATFFVKVTRVTENVSGAGTD